MLNSRLLAHQTNFTELKLKFAIIAGSHRQESHSGRIASYISRKIEENIPLSETYLLNLQGNPLPLWDESVWDGDPKWKENWEPISNELQTADAIILISPEWAGMVPSGLKNLLLFCGGGTELADKPAMIVGVSSSFGGTYPITELRLNSHKNTRMVFIPDHLIIRHCEGIFVEKEPQSEDDKYIRARLDHSLGVLAAYSTALKQVRDAKVVDRKTYPFGM